MNYKKSDKYKYVYRNTSNVSVNGVYKWQGQVGKRLKPFKTEREAAKWVDLVLIDQEREPVNVLVRKQS